MARFYGRGTGANRGYWELQWRDGKGRWIEMGSIGRYIINGVTHTGRMIGGDSADSINMERRTANGKIVEGVVDKINPKDFENLNVKALLDAPEGFSEEEVAQARRAENTRPVAASFPNGTKLNIDGNEHTKNSEDSWTGPDGSTIKNSDVDSRMESSSRSSADIPEEAELTKENILNATDGSTLTWNNKQYSRLDGKWYDEKTGKPVSDKTMTNKTDGDLSTEGGKESFTPTPASEYPTDTRLHAEMNDGQSTADLHKTDDNSWDITTDENSTDVDDATADRVIEAADTIDMDEFFARAENIGPERRPVENAYQMEEEISHIDSEIDKALGSDDEDRDEDAPLSSEERARLEELDSELAALQEDADNFQGEDAKDSERMRNEAQKVRDWIDKELRDDSEKTATSEENETNEPPRADVETATDEPVDERIESIRSEIDRTDDKKVLEDIERELADLDNQLKDSENNDDVIARERIAEARAANNEKYAELEAREDETQELPQSGNDIAWEEEDASAFDPEVQYYEDAITNGYRTQVTKEKRTGERARWRTEVYDEQGDLVGESDSTTQKKARDEAARMVREDAEARESEEDTPRDDSPAEAEAPERTTDDIISDMDSDGAAAIDAISDGSDDDLAQARTQLLDTYQEAQRAIDSPDTSNEDKVRLQSKVEEVDRAVTAVDQEIARRSSADSDSDSDSGSWEPTESGEGESDSEIRVLDDGAELQVYRNDENGMYFASVFPPGSYSDEGPDDGYETKEKARQAAQESYSNYDPARANRPETHSEEDLANGHQADPQPVDEAASAPDVAQVKQANQDSADNGTFDITKVDSSADFEETSDITERRENAARLTNPQPGDIVTMASGKKQEYIGGGIWQSVDEPVKLEIDNDVQKKINKAGPEPIRVGSMETEPPVAAQTNKHGISLSHGPTMIRATLADGTEVTYQKHKGAWHRRLDNEGNLAPDSIKRDRLNDILNKAEQAAAVEPERTVKRPKVQDTPTPDAPKEPKEQGLTPGGKTPHKPATEDTSAPLGAHVTDKVTQGEPGTLLTQNGAPVGYVGPDGTPYYVGDRVIYQDRSKRTRSVRIAAIGAPDGNGNHRIDMIPDEHDILTPEGKMPYDEWRALSKDDRVAAGMDADKYSNVSSMMSHMFEKNRVRQAQNENKDDVNAEHQRRKEEGKVRGVNVATPEFLPEEEVSRDRVYRDESTRIIGTLNKHGELFKPGEVVTFGPDNEVGTIVRVGEADDVIRIAPNGQSALEAKHYHVDTIAHSNKPATYYDENYDVPASERVVYDRFNDPVRVGDTIYRYGLPFTVKDIYPDGRKLRVVGQDWAGEQGSTPAVQFSRLIDMGVDEELAKKISRESEHDFMPEHLQLFTGDVNDIRSIRTHDSHMWSMVRDDQGRVIESHPENRAAAQTRATGNRNDQKIINAQWARDMAERSGDDVRLDVDGIQPGQYIDQVFGQAVSDNYGHYVEVTFGTNMVIPDNSRLVGQDRFGNPEFYIKKDNKWRIEGIDSDDYEMTAQEFGRYRIRNAYDPGKDFEGDIKQRNKGLVYMGDADAEIAPKPGQRISKDDAPTFKLMPIGAVVRFVDADGNIITIRKGPDGEWYKTTESGAWSGSAKPVDVSKIPGSGSYRGQYNRQSPLPATSDRSSEEYRKNNVQRQKLRQERNATRRGKGGEDRIYGSHISGERTYREERGNSDNVRDSREANERLAEENERLAAENQAAQDLMRQMEEELRRLRGDDDDAVTASGDRIVAVRKGTDHVLAVYNRVDGNVWEYISSGGHRREFTMDDIPNTPGVTYKVEEKTA